MSARIRYVFDCASASASARVGAKAAALSRLSLAFPVPDFFVIVAEGFAEGAMLASARVQAAAALAALGEGPFAVRSSARDEDSAQHAHAGQYASQLGVRAVDVFAAAERVWRSGTSESLARYRAARGLSAEPHPPAIIVQRMVEPTAAGIAFSACPLTGDRGVVVINAAAGRGDRLAAGHVDGNAYRVSAAGEVSADSIETAHILSDDECRAVAHLARAAAAHFGAPQDIEWALSGGKLHLLQSRAITTLPSDGAHSGAQRTGEKECGPEGPRSKGARSIWDNSNIVESYPGVVAPLTYSFARYAYAHVYRAFSRLMGVSAKQIEAHAQVFDNLLRRIDGRVYYDLVNWRRALALFPGFKSNSAFMDQMMGLSEPFPPELADEIAPPSSHKLSRFLEKARLGRVALGLLFNAVALDGASIRFRKRLNRALATPDGVIDKASSQQLAREYRRLEDLLLTRWDAPLINDFLCMVAFGASRKALEVWAGDEGRSLHSDIMIGQGDIVSAEPARLINAMGKVARRFPHVVDALAAGDRDALADAPGLEPAVAAYLRKFGDRCVQELKLESIPLHEDPTPLLRAIAATARKDVGATLAIARFSTGAARATTRVAPTDTRTRLRLLFRSKPFTHLTTALLLSYAKARVRDRENLRFERTRLFGRVRRIFRTLGVRLSETGVLNRPRDIFYLTIDEALDAAERNAAPGLNLIAARRRAEDADSSARPDPPERIDTARPFCGSTADNHDNIRSGLACCSGNVIARARVISDPRVELPEPGEILVARATDPGWIAAFVNAAGIIAERGSLLSHSAIVARELGVPCVVGLKGATEWLRNGDLVRLDGAAGTVEVLER